MPGIIRYICIAINALSLFMNSRGARGCDKQKVGFSTCSKPVRIYIRLIIIPLPILFCSLSLDSCSRHQHSGRDLERSCMIASFIRQEYDGSWPAGAIYKSPAQSSPLSPVLFEFFNSDLVDQPINAHGGVSAFIDDYFR